MPPAHADLLLLHREWELQGNKVLNLVKSTFHEQNSGLIGSHYLLEGFSAGANMQQRIPFIQTHIMIIYLCVHFDHFSSILGNIAPARNCCIWLVNKQAIPGRVVFISEKSFPYAEDLLPCVLPTCRVSVQKFSSTVIQSVGTFGKKINKSTHSRRMI